MQPTRPGEHSEPPPVLALGAGITLLGVLRALGRRGITAYSLADEPIVVRHSRYYRPAPGPRAHARPPTDLGAYLEASGLERAVLIPCSDDWSHEVASLDPAAAAAFPASVSPPATQAQLIDKAAFASLLLETGTPHPRTLLVEGPADLEGADDAFLERAFLKPRDSQAFFRRFRIKGVRPDSPDELRTRLTQFQDLGIAMIVQEYVPGPAKNHYFIDGFLDRHGAVKARLVRQRLRMYPTDFGNSSFMRSVDPGEAAPAVEAIERLLGGIGFRGIYSAEFKRDERDGAFRLLEVNARAWWYLEFAARCGVDVAWLAYLDALGEPVPEQFDYEVGRTLAFPRYDLFACLEARKRGEASLPACLASWMGSDRPVFTWDDPMPAVRDVAHNATNSILKRLGRRVRVPSTTTGRSGT